MSRNFIKSAIAFPSIGGGGISRRFSVLGMTRYPLQAPENGDGGSSGGGDPAASGSGDSGGTGAADESAKWQAKWQAEKAARVEAEKLASQLKNQYTGIDLEEYKTLKTAKEQAAEEELRKRGEFEKIENSYKTNIQALEGERNEWQQKYVDLELNTKLMPPFAEAEGEAIWADDYLKIARKFITYKDGKIEVHDEDGGPLIRTVNKQSVRVETLKDLATYIKEETRYGVFFKAKDAEGGGSKGSPNPLLNGNTALPAGISML